MACTPVASAVQPASRGLFAGSVQSTGDPMSHPIPVVWPCVPGEAAACQGSWRSRSQTQAWGLPRYRSASVVPRVLRAPTGFVLLVPRLPDQPWRRGGDASSSVVLRVHEPYRGVLRSALMPPCGVPSLVSRNVRFSITPERRNFQINRSIFLSLIRFPTSRINFGWWIVSK